MKLLQTSGRGGEKVAGATKRNRRSRKGFGCGRQVV